MRRPTWLCALPAAALAAPAVAVTPEEAQSLPLAELARRVLGEAGAAVVDVDRPEWPTCDIMCPPLTEQQRRQAPPLRLGLRFYQRPFAASLALHQWTGLCGTNLIFVHYDEQGRVSAIATGQRWGVPNGMGRIASPPPAQEFMSRLAAETAKCQGADLRTFFVADDDVSALRVAVAAQLFAEAASRSDPLPFKLACNSHLGDCKGRDAVETVAAAFQVSRITQVSQVDCAKPERPIVRYNQDGCYELSLDRPGESILVEIGDAYSDLRIKRVEYRLGTVVY
jgi:hypothetical protein